MHDITSCGTPYAGLGFKVPDCPGWLPPPDMPFGQVRNLADKYAAGVTRSVVRCNDTGAFLKLLSETDPIGGGADRRRIAHPPWRETLQAFDIGLIEARFRLR